MAASPAQVRELSASFERRLSASSPPSTSAHNARLTEEVARLTSALSTRDAEISELKAALARQGSADVNNAVRRALRAELAEFAGTAAGPTSGGNDATVEDADSTVSRLTRENAALRARLLVAEDAAAAAEERLLTMQRAASRRLGDTIPSDEALVVGADAAVALQTEKRLRNAAELESTRLQSVLQHTRHELESAREARDRAQKQLAHVSDAAAHSAKRTDAALRRQQAAEDALDREATARRV